MKALEKKDLPEILELHPSMLTESLMKRFDL